MIRALRFFALLTAFFVVAVRCLGGVPLVLACGSVLPESPAAEFCPATDQPVSDDTLAPVALDDDSDDGADALLAPAPLELSVLTYGIDAGIGRGALAPQRALPSHALGLDRPPRA